MPANDTVGYDHAEIDAAVKKINELAERAENECEEKALAMKKKVRDETSRNTRGGPAPRSSRSRRRSPTTTGPSPTR
jgi:hypothetical protein